MWQINVHSDETPRDNLTTVSLELLVPNDVATEKRNVFSQEYRGAIARIGCHHRLTHTHTQRAETASTFINSGVILPTKTNLKALCSVGVCVQCKYFL